MEELDSLLKEKAGKAESTKLLDAISKDHSLAEKILAKLSGVDDGKTSKKEKNNKPPTTTPQTKLDLTRPPWINDVKEAHGQLLQNQSYGEQMQVDDSFFYMNYPQHLPKRVSYDDQYAQKYPLYTSVKRIMFAHGDLRDCLPESVLEMTKFAEDLASLMLRCVTVSIQRAKFEGKKAKKEKSKVVELKKIWRKLFPAEYRTFYSIKKHLRTLNKLEDLEAGSEDSSEEEFSESEAITAEQEIYDAERKKFNENLVESMNQVEYFEFNEARATNFLSCGRQQFLDFINLEAHKMDYLKNQKLQLEFISYVLCKKIGTVVERANRSLHNGILKALEVPLDTELLKSMSKTLLKGFEIKLNQIKKASTSLEERAYHTFRKSHERVSIKINTARSQVEKTMGTKHKESDEAVKNSLLEWRKMKPRLRQLWIERYLAEKQLHNTPAGENLDDLMPINDYADFLFQSFRVKDGITEERMDELFEAYIEAQLLGTFVPPIKKVHKEIPLTDIKKDTATVIEKKSIPQPKPVGKKSARTRLESIFT